MRELTVENLDQAALAALLGERDPLGVLSVYVDAHPGAGETSAAAPAIDIRNRLGELERRLEAAGPAERLDALRRTLRRHASAIEGLLDQRARGRGRALYLPLGGGEPTRFSNRLAPPNRVVLDESAFVHPLLELLDEGRPAGVAVLSRRDARVLEWRFGELRSLEQVTIEEIEAPHERSGPVGSSAGIALSTPVREQRAARLRGREQVLLAEVARRVGDLAERRGWDRVLVAGDERLAEPLARVLPETVRVVRDAGTIARLAQPGLEARVTERLLADNRDREQRLVRAIRDAALRRGPAALGLSEVLAALTEGRVAHVVYDPGVRYTGWIDERGALRPDGGAPPAGTLPEPRLTERIIERAMATGARVSPVEHASAEVLAEAGGIAALLRW